MKSETVLVPTIMNPPRRPRYTTVAYLQRSRSVPCRLSGWLFSFCGPYELKIVEIITFFTS